MLLQKYDWPIKTETLNLDSNMAIFFRLLKERRLLAAATIRSASSRYTPKHSSVGLNMKELKKSLLGPSRNTSKYFKPSSWSEKWELQVINTIQPLFAYFIHFLTTPASYLHLYLCSPWSSLWALFSWVFLLMPFDCSQCLLKLTGVRVAIPKNTITTDSINSWI